MTVTALYRYPVKSMLGESIARAVITERGVLGDRRYAVLDVETNMIASAKVPKRWAAILDFSARYVSEPTVDGDIPPVEITFPDGSTRRSDDPGIDKALSDVFGRDLKLVTVAPEGSAFEELWPDISGLAPDQFITDTLGRHEDTGEAISRLDLAGAAKVSGTFFDLSTLHVLTESTLDSLRAAAPDATFDVRRYRPNIVLGDAGDGFVENDWPGGSAAIGGSRVEYSFATMRCVMTTLPQGDLPRDADTLRAIAKNNRIEIPQVGGVWACAGVYAEVAEQGEISVGDAHEAPVPA
jgi:uncharacterized protein